MNWTVWAPAILSLLIPIAAVRGGKSLISSEKFDDAAMMAQIKEKNMEIAKICRKSVEKWLATADRPEQITLSEIESELERAAELQC